MIALGVSACASSRKGDLSKADKARLFVEAGNAALLDGDPSGALEHFLKAEELDSSLPELHHSMSLAFAQKGDLNTSLAEARKAVELEPKYSEANNTLGKLLIDFGKLDEAAEPLLRASKDPLYRDSYKPLTNLGRLYYRKGDYAQSLDFLNKAILASPGNACIAYYYRGHVRLRESRFREAIHDYELATHKFCAGFADAHLALGIAYEKNHQYDLARKKFMEIQEQYPSSKVADQAVNHLRFLP
jgi:tetratricopeptide (TPR) repeat protein